MTYMYTDESRECLVEMLPRWWHDTFRAVWNLRTESPDEEWGEALAGVPVLGLSNCHLDPGYVEALRFAANTVAAHKEEFSCHQHAEAIELLLTGARYDDLGDKQRTITNAYQRLLGWYRDRIKKGY